MAKTFPNWPIIPLGLLFLWVGSSLAWCIGGLAADIHPEWWIIAFLSAIVGIASFGAITCLTIGLSDG